MRSIAHEVSRDAYVLFLDQYRVVRRASFGEMERSPCLAHVQRPVPQHEYEDVIECARRAGLDRFAH